MTVSMPPYLERSCEYAVSRCLCIQRVLASIVIVKPRSHNGRVSIMILFNACGHHLFPASTDQNEKESWASVEAEALITGIEEMREARRRNHMRVVAGREVSWWPPWPRRGGISEVGFSINLSSRLANHHKHQKSNKVMTLFDACAMHLFIDRYSIQGFPVVRIVSPHAVDMAKWRDGE